MIEPLQTELPRSESRRVVSLSARGRRRLILGLAAIAMLGLAASACACTVCFGDSDDPIVKGLEASVLFLVAVTYTLLGGGVLTVILLRRRARRLAEQTASATGA